MENNRITMYLFFLMANNFFLKNAGTLYICMYNIKYIYNKIINYIYFKSTQKRYSKIKEIIT